MKFNLPNNNGKLPTDQHRALKNYRLMQWAKVATFGLYMVAVFMLYVSDVWGVASFVTQNSNEFIALSVFSIISFVLAFFLASSKEAVYEDIALHRSEGWKLKRTQYAAMGLFLSSGILFEMFSTTNNQQHIANTAAEQSTMMKSIQGTDVSLLGSANLTDSFASAQMKLAQCEQRLAQGKEKHCAGAKARVDAVRESMTMSNQLATTAAQQSVDNKVDGMLKIREHFDKPMFQAIGKATGTDNNSGMLMVIGVLIFIFECQHIMALFAYANSLARINRKVGNTGTSGNTDSSPAPLGESAPVSAFAPLADSAKQTVAEFAKKVEQGLKSAPEIVATEYARADFANKQVLADAGRIGGKIGAKLDDALNAENRKNHPQKIQFPVGEGKTADDYDLIPRTDKTPTLSGENTVKYLTPKMSVADTVKHIQASVKQSGASSPEAITAAVFDTFAAMPNPAPLPDVFLERIAGKLADKAIPTAALSVPFHQQAIALGQVEADLNNLTGQVGQGQVGQVEADLNNDQKMTDLREKLAETEAEKVRLQQQAEADLKKAEEQADTIMKAKQEAIEADRKRAEEQAAREQAEAQSRADLAAAEAEKVRLQQQAEADRKADLGDLTEDQVRLAADAIKSAIALGQVSSLGRTVLKPVLSEAGLPRSTESVKKLIKWGCTDLIQTGLVSNNPNPGIGRPEFVIV